MFSEDLPLRARLFNIIVGICLILCAFATVATFVQAASFFARAATAVTLAVMVLLVFWPNMTGYYRFGSFVLLTFVCDIMFPVIFFSTNGLGSGIMMYMLLGSIITFLLLDGMDCIVMIAIYLAVVLTCIYLSYARPGLVVPFDNRVTVYTDNAYTMVFSSVAVGLIIKFQNKVYIDARRRAEEASAAKADFLSNMSHEMRTPMNAIIGMTAIGHAAADVERKDYAFSKIEAASSHLLGVINDILDMSKIEAGKLELSYEEFDFENMLQRVAGVINFRAEEKNQNFTMHIDSDIPRALISDDQRLAQVITNLLSNAVKFTPEHGNIKLNARLVGTGASGCSICVEVVDDGIGISPEQQLLLFVSFQQAENSTSRKFGGTGLGLAISKRIVEMMGGEIWVESELGRGSTFAFTVTCRYGGANGSLDTVAPDDAAPGESVREEYSFDGAHILVAEDVEINREIVSAILEPSKLEIDYAENGTEAVRIFGESPNRYALIFMDVQMPEMDGYEATRRIRAMSYPRAKAVPIIAMTANVFREDIERCLACGMDDHIGKPLDFDEVLNKLRQYMRRPTEPS
ncbi:MAG: response regulator [Oscillospiraceae bacterium]|jgi:signal transduction histidine kinase/ActR/RegA family two-component response regulator|nr:response regulator [Oscillospiraceae bacterium]